MPLDLTPALRLFAARRLRHLARLNPIEAQRATLRGLLRAARETRFGRDHGFATLRDVADFQAAVPLRTWDDMWATYWQPAYPRLQSVTWPGRIPYFAITSGTTAGKSKSIPVSRQMLRSNRRAALDVLAFHLARRPDSRVWGGPNFMVGGSTDLTRLEGGARAGDLSGIASAEVPWFARGLSYPPPDIALMPDWDAKMSRLVADLPGRDVRLISGTPSWVIELAERLRAATGKPTLGALFPNLEVMIHGGVAFAPYRHRFEALLAGSAAELAEVYPASEGFIAAQDEGSGAGLRMMVDTGLFFEFVPPEDLETPNPRRHWLADAEIGRDYALVVSTCAGLWGHVIGDTVRLISRTPPRLLVTGRTGWSLSIAGEHLIAAEVERAVARAGESAGVDVTDWTMGPVAPAEGDGARRRPYHVLLVDCAQPPDQAATAHFARILDADLANGNDDYEAHRSAGLDPPQVVALPRGAFSRWMAALGRAGGQNKVPRLIGDPDRFATMRRELEEAGKDR